MKWFTRKAGGALSELNYKNNEAPEKKFFSRMSEMRILNLSLEKINKQKEKFSAQVSQQRFFAISEGSSPRLPFRVRFWRGKGAYLRIANFVPYYFTIVCMIFFSLCSRRRWDRAGENPWKPILIFISRLVSPVVKCVCSKILYCPKTNGGANTQKIKNDCMEVVLLEYIIQNFTLLFQVSDGTSRKMQSSRWRHDEKGSFCRI